MIVCDESHYIKNPKASRTKALVPLIHQIPRALLLTGTPMVSNCDEIYAQIYALKPTIFSSYDAFKERYDLLKLYSGYKQSLLFYLDILQKFYSVVNNQSENSTKTASNLIKSLTKVDDGPWAADGKNGRKQRNTTPSPIDTNGHDNDNHVPPVWSRWKGSASGSTGVSTVTTSTARKVISNPDNNEIIGKDLFRFTSLTNIHENSSLINILSEYKKSLFNVKKCEIYLQELYYVLYDYVMIRRLKKHVLLSLPSKHRNIINIAVNYENINDTKDNTNPSTTTSGKDNSGSGGGANQKQVVNNYYKRLVLLLPHAQELLHKLTNYNPKISDLKKRFDAVNEQYNTHVASSRKVDNDDDDGNDQVNQEMNDLLFNDEYETVRKKQNQPNYVKSDVKGGNYDEQYTYNSNQNSLFQENTPNVGNYDFNEFFTQEDNYFLLKIEQQVSKNGGLDLQSQRALIMRLYQITGLLKLPYIIQYVDYLLSHQHKDNKQFQCIIFAHHLFILDVIQEYLEKKGVSYFRVDGSVSNVDRQLGVDLFQSNETTESGSAKIRVALLSITAAGLGLTLTKAHTVIFAEIYWTPSALVQAEDRCHRLGQDKDVDIYYLLAEDGLDMRLWPLVQEKLETTSVALDGVGDTSMNKVNVVHRDAALTDNTTNGYTKLSLNKLVMEAKNQKKSDKSLAKQSSFSDFAAVTDTKDDCRIDLSNQLDSLYDDPALSIPDSPLNIPSFTSSTLSQHDFYQHLRLNGEYYDIVTHANKVHKDWLPTHLKRRYKTPFGLFKYWMANSKYFISTNNSYPTPPPTSTFYYLVSEKGAANRAIQPPTVGKKSKGAKKDKGDQEDENINLIINKHHSSFHRTLRLYRFKYYLMRIKHKLNTNLPIGSIPLWTIHHHSLFSYNTYDQYYYHSHQIIANYRLNIILCYLDRYNDGIDGAFAQRPFRHQQTDVSDLSMYYDYNATQRAMAQRGQVSTLFLNKIISKEQRYYHTHCVRLNSDGSIIGTSSLSNTLNPSMINHYNSQHQPRLLSTGSGVTGNIAILNKFKFGGNDMMMTSPLQNSGLSNSSQTNQIEGFVTIVPVYDSTVKLPWLPANCFSRWSASQPADVPQNMKSARKSISLLPGSADETDSKYLYYYICQNQLNDANNSNSALNIFANVDKTKLVKGDIASIFNYFKIILLKEDDIDLDLKCDYLRMYNYIHSCKADYDQLLNNYKLYKKDLQHYNTEYNLVYRGNVNNINIIGCYNHLTTNFDTLPPTIYAPPIFTKERLYEHVDQHKSRYTLLPNGFKIFLTDYYTKYILPPHPHSDVTVISHNSEPLTTMISPQEYQKYVLSLDFHKEASNSANLFNLNTIVLNTASLNPKISQTIEDLLVKGENNAAFDEKYKNIPILSVYELQYLQNKVYDFYKESLVLFPSVSSPYHREQQQLRQSPQRPQNSPYQKEPHYQAWFEGYYNQLHNIIYPFDFTYSPQRQTATKYDLFSRELYTYYLPFQTILGVAVNNSNTTQSNPNRSSVNNTNVAFVSSLIKKRISTSEQYQLLIQQMSKQYDHFLKTYHPALNGELLGGLPSIAPRSVQVIKNEPISEGERSDIQLVSKQPARSQSIDTSLQINRMPRVLKPKLPSMFSDNHVDSNTIMKPGNKSITTSIKSKFFVSDSDNEKKGQNTGDDDISVIQQVSDGNRCSVAPSNVKSSRLMNSIFAPKTNNFAPDDDNDLVIVKKTHDDNDIMMMDDSLNKHSRAAHKPSFDDTNDTLYHGGESLIQIGGAGKARRAAERKAKSKEDQAKYGDIDISKSILNPQKIVEKRFQQKTQYIGGQSRAKEASKKVQIRHKFGVDESDDDILFSSAESDGWENKHRKVATKAIPKRGSKNNHRLPHKRIYDSESEGEDILSDQSDDNDYSDEYDADWIVENTDEEDSYSHQKPRNSFTSTSKSSNRHLYHSLVSSDSNESGIDLFSDEGDDLFKKTTQRRNKTKDSVTTVILDSDEENDSDWSSARNNTQSKQRTKASKRLLVGDDDNVTIKRHKPNITIDHNSDHEFDDLFD